jgi:hypothetical protein
MSLKSITISPYILSYSSTEKKRDKQHNNHQVEAVPTTAVIRQRQHPIQSTSLVQVLSTKNVHFFLYIYDHWLFGQFVHTNLTYLSFKLDIDLIAFYRYESSSSGAL